MCYHEEIIGQALNTIVTVDIVDLPGGKFDILIIAMKPNIITLTAQRFEQIRRLYKSDYYPYRAAGLREVFFIRYSKRRRRYDRLSDYNPSPHGLCIIPELIKLERELREQYPALPHLELGAAVANGIPNPPTYWTWVSQDPEVIPPHVQAFIGSISDILPG